ncbi:unnamed protein product (macronuclear) [Paramecium tetraurelia]|uniref:Choline transporter-like protein n=1 Tax=Paramecium tetraurelia TaxID=5888 RepID=A0DPQ7_PARTE|nr:uncharacterized protein GSPATT00019206001 [Paramecium tetraurelia]CAK85024.1 unnamed protein product [Paramecium tetraurelia]|eukprot:XP_001452421.1 hypothetical protein (macronuclear) [Paramecium tetraurelia strain d4-2]
MSSEKGEGTDPKLRNGPVVDRECTDIFCLLLFIVFTFGMFFISGYAFKNGDPHRIAQPYDPDHRACGVDEDVADYPYIYFANPTNPKYLYVTTCVSECPQEESEPAPSARHTKISHLEEAKTNSKLPSELKCQPNSIVKSCKQNMLSTNPEEVVVIYNTELFMKTVCLPTTKQYYETVKDKIDVETMEKVSNDMITTKWLIFGSIGISLVLGFIFLFLIETLAGCVIWTLLLLLFSVLIAGGIYTTGYYYALTDPSKLPASAQAEIDAQTLQEQAQAENVNPKNYLYIGITLFSLAGLILLVVCCMYSRIRLAIAILETACDYVQANFTVVVLPFVTFFIMLLYFIYWFVVALYLYSSGETTSKPKQLPFGQFSFTQNQKIFANIHLFGLLWNSSFIIASVEFIIAGSVCIWYFQQGPRAQEGGPIPLPTAIGRFFRYHLGTVAFGSLILAIIEFIRIWLAFLYKQQEELIKKNKFFEYLFKCLMCCMWCFEKCVQYINKNAYVVSNMTGKGFFHSAKEAIFLIARNPLRFATVGGFGEIFIALGRGFIALLTGLFCYIVITRTEKFKYNVTYPEAPSLLCGAIGLVVGSLFMSIYGVACDAILIVFVMDEEMEKQNGKGVALCCPPKLEKFLEDQ